jgi:2-methylcitrate dehydratase
LSVSAELADFALSLRYGDIPANVLHRAKTILIDALACAIGGVETETGRASRAVALELGGKPEATLIGTGQQVSVGGAVIANHAMLRCLDYNDCLNVYRGPGDLVSAHPSSLLPVVLALGEQQNLSGREALTSLIVGYEVIGRILARMGVSLEARGFHHSAVAAYGAAAVAGRMLGLDRTELVNALGIAGSTHVSLNILDTDGELNVSGRDIVDGLAVERGIVSARLARQGLAGPENIIEGRRGLAEILLGDRDKLSHPPATDRFYLLDTELKAIAADSTTLGYVTGAAYLVRENDVKLGEIEYVTIRANERTVLHCGDPLKKHPRTRENADHSAFFLTAVGMVDGKVTPASFNAAKYDDPVINRLIDSIRLVPTEEFNRTAPACEVIIRLKSGKTLKKRVNRSDLKGLPENPLTEEDVRQKFIECAQHIIGVKKIDSIIETFLRIDQIERLSDAVKELVIH